MWWHNEEGGGHFPICLPVREDARVWQHESKTKKAPYNKVRSIVKQM